MSAQIQSSPTTIYNAVPPVRAEATGGPQPSDAVGNSYVTMGTALAGEDSTNNLIGVLAKPVVSATYSWIVYTNFGTSNAAVIKASAGQVGAVYCHNNSGSVRYCQIHQKSTIPLTTEVPIFSFYVPVGGVLVIDDSFFGMNGQYFSSGIGFAISTSEATYGVGAAGDAVIHLKYC